MTIRDEKGQSHVLRWLVCLSQGFSMGYGI